MATKRWQNERDEVPGRWRPGDHGPKQAPRGLRIAVWVLLVPSLILAGVYVKGILDPPDGREAGDFVSGGAPVFFITVVLLWLIVHKPTGRDD